MLPSSPPVVDLKPRVPPSPFTPLRTFKSEPNLIDLCTPEVKLPPGVPSKPSFVPPQLYSRVKVEAIDLCSPDYKPVIHSVNTAPGLVRVGDIFNSWEEAQTAVYACEEHLGFQWRIGQGKLDSGGHWKKVTFQCQQYYHTSTTHGTHLDPSDFCQGKSIHTGCEARININRVQNTTNLW